MQPLIRLAFWVIGTFVVGKAIKEYVVSRRKVFVSFDYENDKHYKFLMNAWDANPDFDFTFRDASSAEINSWKIGRIKAALTTKIKAASVTLVIVGKEANKRHRDAHLIGHRNWVNFEIAKSKEAGNRIVAVKLHRAYPSPDELKGAGARWVYSFSRDEILSALRES